jgi:hypothetical protein
LRQPVSSPLEQPAAPDAQLHTRRHPPVSKRGSLFLLILIGSLLILFASLTLRNLPQLIQQPAAQKAPLHSSASQIQDQDDSTPLALFPGSATQASLTLPAEDYVLYEQQKNIYFTSAAGGPPHVIATPGYIYNRAVSPILMPDGQLLYGGDGLWITDVFTGGAIQIAPLPPGQVITSMALSRDGTTIAWSTEPVDGNGMVNIYAGPLTNSMLVYQQSASDCPCFRVFSFLNAAGVQPNTVLLLTDDRGDHRAVRYGLWAFSMNSLPPQDPQPLLDENPQQGPLTLVPATNSLLYSTYEGLVPPPTDNSVPDDIAALNYANSLSIATIDTKSLVLGTPSIILPEQHQLSSSAEYHWVTTPRFSADGHTLVFVEFSSDAQAPFDRHNALYTVQVTGSGAHLHVGKPRLLATATSLLLELGPWMNSNVLTFYSDGVLYALDIHSGAMSTIVQTGTYAHIVAIVEQG